MQAAMLPFPYSFPCQPYIDTSTTDCVTSSSPLSSPASQTASNLASRCYDSIVTSRFRSHEHSSSKFTGLAYEVPKGFTSPVRKLFTIEAILGLNEDKGSKGSVRASVPTIYTSTIETKDSPPAVYTSHSSLHLQQPGSISVSSSTSPSSKPCTTTVHQKLPAGGGKMKRIRTIFTTEQLERLEMEFERQQYMVGPERMYLASSLGLSESQVKVWFQNRRIKFRKQHLEMQQARLAQIRESGEEATPETDYPPKEVSSTHWEDIRDMMEDRN